MRKYVLYISIILVFVFLLFWGKNFMDTSSSLSIVTQDTIPFIPEPVPPLEQSEQLEQPQIHIEENNPQYTVNLTFEPELNRLTGTSQIITWNRNKNPTNDIYIHLFLNAFKEDRDFPVLQEFMEKVYIRGYQYGGITLDRVQINGEDTGYEIKGELLRVPLDSSWDFGESMEITLEWKANIPDIHHRVGQEKGAFWFGNSLPILAVYDNQWRTNVYEKVGDPFFSEISDYQVNIQTPSNYQVYATGEETEVSNGTIKDTKITAEQVREFAFAITPDHRVQSAETSSGKQINIYYRKADEQLVANHLQKAVEMLEYMEERVGSYPYRELDIFENDMFITGMEYPGIVFVDSKRLNSKAGIQTILHEIVHQWFYNVVGNNQITEPWLDEGMATYFTDEFTYGDQLSAFYEGELKRLKQRPYDVEMKEVQAYNNWSSYWWGDYRKSSLMIYSLKNKLGDEIFDQWIKDYLEVFQYKVVSTEDFIRFTEDYTQDDLSSFFDEWMNLGISTISKYAQGTYIGF